jgi:hypothetical protein
VLVRVRVRVRARVRACALVGTHTDPRFEGVVCWNRLDFITAASNTLMRLRRAQGIRTLCILSHTAVTGKGT